MPNTSLLWDGRLWTLINLGEETTTVVAEAGQPIQLPTEFFLRLLSNGTISIPKAETELSVNQEVCSLMEAASTADLAKANYRFHLVQAYLQRQAEIYRDVSERTLRDWAKKFRRAEAQYGCGYVGLLPRTAKRGNRTAKAPNSASELLDTFIAEYYETPRQAPAISVYRAYQRACEQQNIPPLSNSTFYSRLKKRRGYEQTKKRQGAKAAYALQPWVWELAKSTSRHGDRPLAIAHIDHTQLDIELRSSATGRLLGRPWATLLIDAYSRRILAVYLTFDAPSYRSCMMALRSCVSRFGRFPQTLVVDGGKEFHSVYFDTLLARYHCLKKTRPGGKPRFGSVIERLFGTTNTEFIFNLLGNTQAAKQVRQLTKAINPKRQAVWTLGDLYVFLKEWAYQVYDQGEHEALGTTPREAYVQGMIQAGEREHRRIPYDEEFLMTTRPSTLKGEATVQPGKGIKVNYLYYWSDAFRNPEVERTKVPVRYDPFDVGVAYAYVQGRWVKCISQYYRVFEGRSEKELLLASQEIKQQGKLTRTSPSVSAKRLAEFIANVQEHETLLLQRLRDLEGKQVQSALNDLEIVSVAEAVPQKTELLKASQESSSSGKETELEIPPVDLSRLPVFGEYR
jgi:putative transposase